MTSQWRGLLIQWRHGDDDDRVTDFPLTADLVLEMCSKLNKTFWRSAWLRRSNLELSEQKNIYQTNRFGGSTLRNFTFANSMELNGPLTNFFLKNGPTLGLFFVYFRSFQTNIVTNFTTNQCENDMSIQYTAPGFKPTTFFSFIFGLFKQALLQFLQKINVKKTCPSSIWRRDSNPPPSEHEPPPITTRPGLPPNKLVCIHFCVYGPWWWSSGQHARLLHWRSEFKSRWSLHFGVCQSVWTDVEIKSSHNIFYSKRNVFKNKPKN